MSASTPPPAQEPASDDGLGVIYWILGGVVVVLCVIGLITYSGEKKDEEAQQKAQELTQKFERAGLPVPEDQDIIVRSLGTDGGAVCENPANALGKAILNDQVANGASHVGRRPVIIDRRHPAGRGADPRDLLPRRAAGVPGEDRRLQVR